MKNGEITVTHVAQEKWSSGTAFLLAAIGSAVFSFLFKILWPELPFIDRVGLVFVICAALALVVSALRPQPQSGAVELSEVNFATSTGFNFASVLVALILAAFYVTWW